MKTHLLVLIVFFIAQQLISQDKFIITGTVCDGSTHEPLVFVNIVAKCKQQGIATNAKGGFLLNLSQGNDTLRCSYVGYKTVEIPISVNKDIQLSVNLFAMDVLLQDVTVYAHRLDDADQMEISALSLQSEKIKNITSLFPDVLRSVQMLPGVSTNNEFSSKFNVRGGNPDENLVLVNGTQVYDPYHVKWAQNYSIGIMNTELINKMDLMTGGFPARYGDKMSSVLNIDYREGDKERLRGMASLSLMDVDVVAEGPLSQNGSFIIGARKSYLEYIMKLASPKAAKANIFPTFYDVQGVVNYSLTPGNKLLLKFIHAGDDLVQDTTTKQNEPYKKFYSGGSTDSQESGNSNSMQMQYYSTLLALQSVNIISSSTIVKSELSLYDQSENERSWNNEYSYYRGERPGYVYYSNWKSENMYHNNLRIRTMELNSTIDQQWSSMYGIKAGLSYQHITYEEDQRVQQIVTRSFNYYYDDRNVLHQCSDTTTIQINDNKYDFFNNLMNTRSFKLAGYVENVVQLSDQLLLNIGGRFDYFDLNKELTWSPRINLAYQIMGGFTIRGAWGYYYQSPNYRQVAYPAASDTNTQSQRAVHYVLGTDYTVSLDPEEKSFLKMKVECFYKEYNNLMSATNTSYGYVYYSRKNDAVGDSKGVDVYIMYSVPSFYGWLSYSFLSANQDLLNDNYGSFPRNVDQKHTLAAVVDLDLGSRWSMNMRFAYGSGYPYTPLSYKKLTNNSGEWMAGAPNSERLPFYSRVDLRITKSFEMFGLAASAFLDVSNMFAAKNIFAYQYMFNNNQTTKKEINLPPLIPSLGIAIRF
jgi:outer membrane receptor for ferrienterochelin and colicin